MLFGYILLTGLISFNYLFVSRVTRDIGIPDIISAIFSDVAFEILIIAFLQLPTMVVAAKIIPGKIEATGYALFTSVGHFSSHVISPTWGAFIARMVGVSTEDYSNMEYLVLIQLGFIVVPMLMLWVLPSEE